MERDIGERRREALAGISGRVLEVGAGNGMNFGHYPDSVSEVIALEPEPYLRGRAEEAAHATAVKVTVLDGLAYPLRFDDDSFDAAVTSLVLCTIPDPAAALAEARRVLKPDGELRFVEHVVSEQPRKARIQHRVDRWGLWPRFVGGCHASRDTVAAIEAAGFRIQRLEHFGLGPSWGITYPHVLGTARPGLPSPQ